MFFVRPMVGCEVMRSGCGCLSGFCCWSGRPWLPTTPASMAFTKWWVTNKNWKIYSYIKIWIKTLGRYYCFAWPRLSYIDMMCSSTCHTHNNQGRCFLDFLNILFQSYKLLTYIIKTSLCGYVSIECILWQGKKNELRNTYLPNFKSTITDVTLNRNESWVTTKTFMSTHLKTLH